MRLGQKQELFAKLIAELIVWAYKKGYKIRLGDAFRDPRVFGMIGTQKGYGHKNSAHKRKLAMDLNLFLNGEYLDETEQHRELGEKWKSMHPLCRWGGDFPNPDGNHYSLEHNGHS